MTMEQVSPNFNEKYSICVHKVTSQSRLADAVRAVNNLATAQVRTETPTLIDVKGLGRPKEFIGREEDFQQWSKKWRRSLLL